MPSLAHSAGPSTLICEAALLGHASGLLRHALGGEHVGGFGHQSAGEERGLGDHLAQAAPFVEVVVPLGHGDLEEAEPLGRRRVLRLVAGEARVAEGGALHEGLGGRPAGGARLLAEGKARAALSRHRSRKRRAASAAAPRKTPGPKAERLPRPTTSTCFAGRPARLKEKKDSPVPPLKRRRSASALRALAVGELSEVEVVEDPEGEAFGPRRDGGPGHEFPFHVYHLSARSGDRFHGYRSGTVTGPQRGPAGAIPPSAFVRCPRP